MGALELASALGRAYRAGMGCAASRQRSHQRTRNKETLQEEANELTEERRTLGAGSWRLGAGRAEGPGARGEPRGLGRGASRGASGAGRAEGPRRPAFLPPCGRRAVRPRDRWPPGPGGPHAGSGSARRTRAHFPSLNCSPFSRTAAREGHSVFSLLPHAPPEHSTPSGCPAPSWKGRSQEGRADWPLERRAGAASTGRPRPPGSAPGAQAQPDTSRAKHDSVLG